MSKSEPVGRASYPASVFQPAMARSRTAGIEVGAILTSILIIATCGLVYELIIGSLSSYLMGDSVFQFSLTLGFYLSAMGICRPPLPWLTPDRVPSRIGPPRQEVST